MILMRANPLSGALEGPKKFKRFRALPMAQVMDLPASNHYIQGRINNSSIGIFMYIGPK